jgi:addiction module HigA family antidote
MVLRIPTHRRPTAPGEIILHEFIEPLGITQTVLAQHLGITYHRLNEIVNGKRGITTDTAMRLERVLGPSAGFWLNAQYAVDLYDAMHSPIAKVISRLEPLRDGFVTEPPLRARRGA